MSDFRRKLILMGMIFFLLKEMGMILKSWSLCLKNKLCKSKCHSLYSWRSVWKENQRKQIIAGFHKIFMSCKCWVKICRLCGVSKCFMSCYCLTNVVWCVRVYIVVIVYVCFGWWPLYLCFVDHYFSRWRDTRFQSCFWQFSTRTCHLSRW